MPPLALLRRLACLLALCASLASGCSRGPLILVAVANLPPETSALLALITLDGDDAQERPSFSLSGLNITPETLYRFGLRLPAEVARGGALVVAVAAVDGRGCLIATGDASVASDGAPEQEVGVPLVAFPEAERRRCAQRPPFVLALEPDMEALPFSAKGTPRSVRGWGFDQGATVSLVPLLSDADLDAVCAPQRCPAPAQPVGGVERLAPTTLTFPAPAPVSTAGRDLYCVVVRNPDGATSCRPTQTYRFPFARTRIPLTADLGAATLHPDALALSDLDADGDIDIALSATAMVVGQPARGVVLLLWGQGGGRFPQTPQIIQVAARATSIVAADLDSDKRTDLIVSDDAAERVRVLRNLGGRSFAPERSYDAVKPDSLAAADLDGDGLLDLAVVNNANNPMDARARITLLRSAGVASAADPFGRGAQTREAGSTLGFVLSGDLNGDRQIDLAVTGLYFDVDCGTGMVRSTTGGVSVLLNQGGGAFPEVSQCGNRDALFPTAGIFASMSMADLDGDGDQDLVAGGRVVIDQSRFGSVVSVLRNNGQGTAFARQDFPAGHAPFAVAVLDLPGARRSLMVAGVPGGNEPGRLTLLVNQDGKGGFPLSGLPDYAAGLGSAALAVGDVDRDGQDDLVLAGFGVINPQDAGKSAAGEVVIYRP